MKMHTIYFSTFSILVCLLKFSNLGFAADPFSTPENFPYPVYVSTELETEDGSKFQIKGETYTDSASTKKNEQLGKDTFDILTLQGYANESDQLDKPLQIYMNGDAIGDPITKLETTLPTINIKIPNYTVVLAIQFNSAGLLWGKNYFAVGIKNILKEGITYEPAPVNSFPFPVYVTRKPVPYDGKSFEIKLTGNKRYIFPESIHKIENFGAKSPNLIFQGYANESDALDTGTQLQILIDGKAVNPPIRSLGNSETRPIEIADTPYTVFVAFKFFSTNFLGLGEKYFAVGIADIKINPEIKDFLERMPLVSKDASDLLKIVKTELEDKIALIPLPNADIIQRKDGINKQITALKNTLTTIVTENSNFPSPSEAGKQYISESEKSLTEAQSTIDQLKQSLQTLTNDATAAETEAKNKLESEQRTVIRDRANSLFATMNEAALKTLRERLENSEPNLKQANKTDVDRLINKTNELQETFKELNQTLSTSDFDIKETDQKLSSYETDFKKLNNEINQYTAKQKDIIIGKLAPLKDKVEKFTLKIKEIDNILSRITPAETNLNKQSFLITEKLLQLRAEIRGIETKPAFSDNFAAYILVEPLIIKDLNLIETQLPILKNNANAKISEIAAEKARIEAEEKAKAAEESKRAKEIIDLAKNVNILLKTSIPLYLEEPLNGATINTKAEDELRGLKSDIEKLKNPLTDILSNLENPDVNIISEQKVLAESQRAFDNLKTQVDAFITKNDKLNELEAKGQTEQPAPTDFPTPVYLTTNTDTIDGIKFELKMAGLRYQNSGTKTYEKEALGGDTVNTAFQGYANSNGILAPDTELQILMDGKPVTLNASITPLPNSENENKDFEIPGTDYTATIAYKYSPPGRIWGNAYYTVGLKKVINNKLTYEPAPTNSFSIPVYVATNVATKDNNKFEIKLTGKQYVYPESIRKIESIEGKPFNLIFQGYANETGNLDAGTQLQIYVNGTPITDSKPITPLQNSRTKDIDITTPDGQFYTITLAFYRSSTTFGYGENYYAVGIKNVEINKRLTDLKELQIEEDSIVRKAHFDSGIYIKPTQKAADGITATLGIEGYQSKFFADNINGFAFSGFANERGYIYGPSSLVLTTNSGEKILLGNSIVTTPISKTYPITVNGIPMLAGIEYKKQPADDFAKSRGLTDIYLIELKDLRITPEEEQKRENEVKLNEEKTYLENNRPVYLNTKEKEIDQIDPTIQGTQGEAKFQLQFNGNIDRTIDPSISPQASYFGAGLVTYANTASGTLNSGSLKLLVNGKEVTFDQGKGPIFKENTPQTVTIPANPVSYTAKITYEPIKLSNNTTGYYASIASVNYQAEAKKKYDEERVNLDNDVNVLASSITSKLEYPLNKASINQKTDNLKEYERLKGEITKLKDPLISILNNLQASDVSVDIVASNNILLGYAQKIDDLQKQVEAFITTNNNLNNIDAKAKAEEAAKKDIVEQNAEFLKSNIPVYIIKDNMQKIKLLTFRVARDNPTTPVPALKKTANIDGKDAEFVGYTDLSGKIEGSTLGIYVDNIKHDLTSRISKDTTQEIKFTAQDNTPYIARVDYTLQDNLDIIEPNSEKILPEGLLKRAYVIRLEPIIEDEAAIKAAEEQRIAEEKKRLIDTVTALLQKIDTSATKEITNVKDPFLSKNRAVLNTQINNLIRDIQGLKTSIENDTISPAEAKIKLSNYQKLTESLIDNVILLKDNDKDITDKKQEIQSRAEAFGNEVNNTLTIPNNFSPINTTISGQQTTLEKDVNDLKFSIQNILNTINSADFNIPGAVKILDSTDNSIKALKARIDNLVTENARLTTEKEEADEIRNQNQALVEAGIQFLQTNTPVYITESTSANSLALDKFIPRKESILRNPTDIEGVSAKFVGYAPGGKLADGASLILKMGTVPVKLTTTSKLPTTSGQQVIKISVPGDRPYPTPYIVTYDVSYKALPVLNTLLSAIPAAERDINTYVITLVSVAPDTQAIAIEEKKIKDADDAKAAEEAEAARVKAEEEARVAALAKAAQDKSDLRKKSSSMLSSIFANLEDPINRTTKINKNDANIQELNRLKNEIFDLKAPLTSLLQNLESPNFDITTAQNALLAYPKNIDDIKPQVTAFIVENNRLNNEDAIEEAKKVKDAAQAAEAARIKAEEDSKAAALAKAAQDKSDLRKKSSDMMSSIFADLEDPLNRTTRINKNDANTQDLNRLKNEIFDLKTPLTNILQNLESPNFDITTAQNILSAYPKNIDNIKPQINAFIIENNRLNNEDAIEEARVKAKTEADAKAAKAARIKAEEEANAAALAKAAQDKSDLRKKSSSMLSSVFADLEDPLNRTTRINKNDANIQELNRLKNEIFDLKAPLTNILQNLESPNFNIADGQNTLSAYPKNIDDIKPQVTAFIAENNRLNNEDAIEEAKKVKDAAQAAEAARIKAEEDAKAAALAKAAQDKSDLRKKSSNMLSSIFADLEDPLNRTTRINKNDANIQDLNRLKNEIFDLKAPLTNILQNLEAPNFNIADGQNTLSAYPKNIDNIKPQINAFIIENNRLNNEDAIEEASVKAKSEADAKATEAARIKAEEDANAAALAKAAQDKSDLSKKSSTMLSSIFSDLEDPLNRTTRINKNEANIQELNRLKNEIFDLKAPLTSLLKNLESPNFNIADAQNTLLAYPKNIGDIKPQVTAFIAENNRLNNEDAIEEAKKVKDAAQTAEAARIKAEEDAKAAALAKAAQDKSDLRKKSSDMLSYIFADLEDPLNRTTKINKNEANTQDLNRLKNEIFDLKTPLTNILQNLESPNFDITTAQKTLSAYPKNIDDLKTQVTAFIVENNRLNNEDTIEEATAKAKAEADAKAAEAARVKAEEDAKAAALAKDAQDKSDLSKKSSAMLSSIFADLEDPLNRTTRINKNDANIQELNRLKNEIFDLKAPLTSLLKNLASPNFNIADAQNILLAYPKNIDDLKPQVTAFIVENNRLNNEDAIEEAKKVKDAAQAAEAARIKAEEDSKAAALAKAAQDKSDLRKKSSDMMSSIFADLEDPLNRTIRINKKDANIQDLNRLKNEIFDLKAPLTNILQNLESLNFNIADAQNTLSAYPKNIDNIKLQVNAFIIENNHLNNEDAIEEARKAAEEAKAKAEAKAAAAKLETEKTELRTKVNDLVNSIAIKLETPFTGVEINKKMETKLQGIKDEIAKLKLREGLTTIRNDLNAFDFTIDVNSIKRTLSDYEQKIDNFKKQIDEFLSTNTNLNDLDKAQEERDRIAEELRKMQEKERETKEKEAQSQLVEVEFLKDHLPIYIDPSTIENLKLDFKDTVGIKSVLPKQISGDNFAGYADSNGNLYKGELLLRINNELYVVIPDGGKLRPDLSVTLGDTTYKVTIKEHRDDVGLKTSSPNTYAVKGYFIEIVPGSVQVEKKVAPAPTPTPREKTKEELFRERVRRHN